MKTKTPDKEKIERLELQLHLMNENYKILNQKYLESLTKSKELYLRCFDDEFYDNLITRIRYIDKIYKIQFNTDEYSMFMFELKSIIHKHIDKAISDRLELLK